MGAVATMCECEEDEVWTTRASRPPSAGGREITAFSNVYVCVCDWRLLAASTLPAAKSDSDWKISW